MTKTLISLIASAALAACGSKPAPTPTAPKETLQDHDHDHDHDGSAAGSAAPSVSDAGDPKAPPRPDAKAQLLAAETSAWETAKPTFTRYCATCHTKDGKKAAKKKLDHFDMDTYPFGGHHTATIGFTIRDVLGISGKKATMPYDDPGAVKGDDLAAIKAWTDAWEAADKAGAHGAGEHDDDEDHHH